MAALDLNSLRDYVKDGSALSAARDGSVLLHVSHSNIKSYSSQIRFDLHTPIERIKERLQSVTATSAGSMQLQLMDASGNLIASLADNLRPLGYYSPQDGFRLHVIDLDPSSITSGGWLDDTSLVEKYVMPDDKYDQLPDSVRKFKQKLLAERPDLMPDQSESNDDYMLDLASRIRVGDRCEIDPGAKRGEVAFVGSRVDGLPAGWWVGVRFDEPVGKHDGRVNGKHIFSAPAGHGSFFRPDKVKVGDYPERDPFEEDEI